MSLYHGRLPPNGSRYRRLEGRDSPTKRNKPKVTRKNPAVRVHALLGSFSIFMDTAVNSRREATEQPPHLN